MVAKVQYIGKIKKYKVIIISGGKIILETFTNTFLQAVKIVEKQKGGKLCEK